MSTFRNIWSNDGRSAACVDCGFLLRREQVAGHDCVRDNPWRIDLHEDFAVFWRPNGDHVLDFRVYPIIRWRGADGSEGVSYGDIAGAESDILGDDGLPASAPCYMDGGLKWDGCINVGFPEYGEQYHMLHFCGPEADPALGRWMRAVYALGPQIPAWSNYQPR